MLRDVLFGLESNRHRAGRNRGAGSGSAAGAVLVIIGDAAPIMAPFQSCQYFHVAAPATPPAGSKLPNYMTLQ